MTMQDFIFCTFSFLCYLATSNGTVTHKSFETPVINAFLPTFVDMNLILIIVIIQNVDLSTNNAKNLVRHQDLFIIEDFCDRCTHKSFETPLSTFHGMLPNFEQWYLMEKKCLFMTRIPSS